MKGENVNDLNSTLLATQDIQTIYNNWQFSTVGRFFYCKLLQHACSIIQSRPLKKKKEKSPISKHTTLLHFIGHHWTMS